MFAIFNILDSRANVFYLLSNKIAEKCVTPIIKTNLPWLCVPEIHNSYSVNVCTSTSLVNLRTDAPENSPLLIKYIQVATWEML